MFNFKTFTLGSPKKPRILFSVFLEIKSSISFTGIPLAFEILSTCSIALSIEILGSSPLPEAVTMSAGIIVLSGSLFSFLKAADLCPVSYTHLTLPTNREV